MTHAIAVQVDDYLALVAGQPLTELPQDLYIPPDALEIFLETFEGPLDLLLYLIKKQNLDILDIPIAAITKQYIEYVELMATIRLELAAEYLVMAATLAEIKSRMLLPRPAAHDEEDDPRAELIRRLQEYEQIKLAAETFDKLPRNGREFMTITVDANITMSKPLPTVALHELLAAYKTVMQRASKFAHHHITREPLSIRERMTTILDRLQRQEFINFSQLFTVEEGKAGIVVAFIAILELLKAHLISIVQSQPLAPIHVKRVSHETAD